VLYAPTWEGGTASAEYSSLEAYGEQIARGVLEDQRFRLVYRPHPLTGTRLRRFGEVDARVAALVEQAARQAPHAGHRVSRRGPAMADLWAADLLVADVSSLAIDFLATGRPLTVTIPPDPNAHVAPTPLLEVVPRLGLADLTDVPAFLSDLLDADTGAEERHRIREYYLGDTAPGAATKAFVEACGRMIELGARNWDGVLRARANGLVGGLAGERGSPQGGVDAAAPGALPPAGARQVGPEESRDGVLRARANGLAGALAGERGSPQGGVDPAAPGAPRPPGASKTGPKGVQPSGNAQTGGEGS
jgi:hypothetical protein